MSIKKRLKIIIIINSISILMLGYFIYIEGKKQNLFTINSAVYQKYMILISLILLVCSIILAIQIVKIFSDGIRKVNNAIDRASDGNYYVRSKYKSNDEIGDISYKFNHMMDSFDKKYMEMTSVYQQLAAAEELKYMYDELEKNQEYLKKIDEKYRLALESANDSVWEYNFETKAFFASDKWYEIMDYRSSQPFDFQYIINNLVHPEDKELALNDLKMHLDGVTDLYKSEVRIRNKDNQYKWVLFKGKGLKDVYGKCIRITGSLSDISERKKIEEQVAFMAYYDVLTKLPNRTYFMERMKEEINKAKQNNSALAVLFIDLDNFKNVNDTLGHNYGDELLIQIARNLQKVIGKDDVPCRLGGDEFLILLTNLKGYEEIVRCATETLKILKNAFELNNKQVFVTGSIGIAIYSKDGSDPNELLKNADAAMYKAKEAGKNKFVFFDAAMLRSLERKTKIERILRNAIDNKELDLFYQPQYDIRSGCITGFEALLRLTNEELGSISPSEFIPIAEECGIIVELGEWCLKKACLKNKELREKGYHYECIGVNISTIQLQQNDFTDVIKRVLEEVGLEPRYLELEITETVLMKSLDRNVAALADLKSMGVKIALDDFGTGYSSLNYLRKIPLNSLKVDKTFIDGIEANSKEEDIANGIIQMAHNMNLEVVAEGVEHQNQLELLKEKQCDKVQGFLFCKPTPGDELERVLKENMELATNNKNGRKHEFKYTGLYSRASKLVDKEK